MEYQVCRNQVSGKSIKYLDALGHYFKQASEIQESFYSWAMTLQIGSPDYALTKYIPRYYGTTLMAGTKEASFAQEDNADKSKWIEHLCGRAVVSDHYLIIENLLFGLTRPNVLDIKIGHDPKKKENKKMIQSTSLSKGFRINGMLVWQPKQLFVNKYYFQSVKDDKLQSHLALFFFDGQQISTPVLGRVIQQLRDIILAYKQSVNWSIQTCSLLLITQRSELPQVRLKLIDFEHSFANRPKQPSFLYSLLNLHTILCTIHNQAAVHTEILQSGLLSCQQNFTNTIPQEKIKKHLDRLLKPK